MELRIAFQSVVAISRVSQRRRDETKIRKSLNLIALIQGDLDHDVALLAAIARSKTWSFDQFYTAVGLLSVLEGFSKKLDHEIWTMTNRRDECVLMFS